MMMQIKIGTRIVRKKKLFFLGRRTSNFECECVCVCVYVKVCVCLYKMYVRAGKSNEIEKNHRRRRRCHRRRTVVSYQSHHGAFT